MYTTNIETQLKKNKDISQNKFDDLKVDLYNDFDLNIIDGNNIFHINDIKKTCIDYRLRFLDSKYFKGDYPDSTLEKIKSFKNSHKINHVDLKVMAPSILFKLKNSDDPLLFCNLGNEYFYLIDKWGNDLSYFRKLKMWPFKSLKNIIIFLVIFTFFISLLIPKGLFVYENSLITEFFITYLFMLKSLIAVVIFFGFSLGKNFNTAIWNRKYFN